MATISRRISRKVSKGVSEIILRVSAARGKVWRIKSGVFIAPERFKADGTIAFPRANQKELAVLRKVERDINDIEAFIIDLITAKGADAVSGDEIKAGIDRLRHPEKYAEPEPEPEEAHAPFFELFDNFLRDRDLSKNRADIYRSLGRCLRRYELYRRASRREDFTLDVDALTAADLSDFEQFYRKEWKLYDKYPDIYDDYPAELRPQHLTHRPAKRGDNITVNMMRKLRTFFNWLFAQEITHNRPFDKYSGIKAERYGTPFYLTIEERDRIADYDLSQFPKLAVQRDIFIFQCMVGCRVSDLRALRASNIVRGAIEYVAAKTRKNRQDVIRVPLGARARALVKRYAGSKDGRLFPFISDQRYNDRIRDICRVCGIDRPVTVIDPTTGKDERRPIYEVASSHMARRTFIGNLYKKVKDPNLVSSLSGHKEGSKAFARYRDIDDDMKREIIDLIE